MGKNKNNISRGSNRLKASNANENALAKRDSACQ